jgi:cytochrome c553
MTRLVRRRQLLRIGAGLAGLAVAGLVVVASGVVPIKASEGHWAVTRWVLSFAMRRSVATHSIGVEAPRLDDAGLVAKGAGHYDLGCRPCHGSPDQPQPVIPRHMTPFPPSLSLAVPQWADDELFYVVKHGVKFTGMPAWPARHRDDEVWAVVAFLRTLPTLTAERYRSLARTIPATGPALEDLVMPEASLAVLRDNCARCHGLDGHGRGLGVFPVLAGQRVEYLFESLVAFARGTRHSGIMQPIAATLSLDVMRDMARHYASRAGTPRPDPPPENRALERGRVIATRGIPDQRVPACSACHGPSEVTRNPVYPTLAGQYGDYLALQLTLFSGDRRGGTPYAHLMHIVASRLTREQMRDVALYFASLSPAADAER